MGGVLRAKEVTRTYGRAPTAVRALAGVDLSVSRGDSLAIMGPSGCGKSTLLYLLGGLDRPTSGSVLWEGRDLSCLADAELSRFRNKFVGFVFQNYSLLPDKKAWENVAVPFACTGLKTRERRERAFSLLSAVGLEDRAEHFPSELSGGEEQRVAIARALANEPQVILADEPTGNLDSASGEQVLEHLKRPNPTTVSHLWL